MSTLDGIPLSEFLYLYIEMGLITHCDYNLSYSSFLKILVCVFIIKNKSQPYALLFWLVMCDAWCPILVGMKISSRLWSEMVLCRLRWSLMVHACKITAGKDSGDSHPLIQ